VDTSSALKKKSADAIREVENILHTAASGQIHMGDTIGLWTFNETLYAGKFPLQQWGHDNGDEIALRAGAFLKEQKFEKTSHLEPALSGMQQVVKGSDIITIFIVSDGSGRMQSTPFDDQINAQYQQNVQEMKKDPQPIITVLQARNGCHSSSSNSIEVKTSGVRSRRDHERRGSSSGRHQHCCHYSTADGGSAPGPDERSAASCRYCDCVSTPNECSEPAEACGCTTSHGSCHQRGSSTGDSSWNSDSAFS
jgi:hypothetical protein